MAYAGYHKLRALIVDDFDSFRMTVSKMLQSLGVRTIDTASHGAEALRLCRAKPYDLVLCDHNLGKGKTGQQVLEELRYHRILDPSAVFILISAESSRSIVMAAYDYEPDEYLTKPVTTRSLQRRLDRLMQRRAAMAPIYRAMEDGELDRAEALCRDEIEGPGRFAPLAQKLLGQIYLDKGEPERAEAVYREALEQRSMDWAMLGMARVKRAQKELVSAQQWLEDTLEEHPLCMQAYDLQAEVCRDKGARERLQKVLEEAVRVSPLAIQRQQHLAETAMTNNDVSTAAGAYRKAVRLGDNSVYDRPDVHLNFARATASLYQEDREQAKQLSRDALKSLADFEQRFGKSAEQQVELGLMEAQIVAGQGDKRRAEELLEQAQSELSEQALVLGVDASLELVKSFRALGRDEEARQLLDDLIESHRDNERELEKIDRLLDEPVSDKNRALVAEINQRGIGHYENTRYPDAIQCFEQALRKFPRHIGVRLNLAQALLDKMEAEGTNKSDYERLSEILLFVAETIRPNHEQFRRFRQLQDMQRRCERQLKAG